MVVESLQAQEKNVNQLVVPLRGHRALEQALSALLPNTQQENKIIKVRKMLGEIAEGLSDEQIEVDLTQFEYLATAWLDDFEKLLFDGKTLQEVVGKEV